MRSLSPAETSSVLALSFAGVLHKSQLPAVTRLHELGVPDEMIRAATLAQNDDAATAAETAIIDWASARWAVSDEEALEVLNARKTLAEVRRQSLD